eukprot:CAMPEP_0194327024 /NCGR_PEP_ID=MMETSP0171-20130528/39327_1 /TAXON_ID=218684 /ORGANISM="Corethron pennatum, Strain L29A3" /LENGTH=44 /DNA_ID= /DNA_START= /DNA_END= /DNA_ORIENTATION=
MTLTVTSMPDAGVMAGSVIDQYAATLASSHRQAPGTFSMVTVAG